MVTSNDNQHSEWNECDWLMWNVDWVTIDDKIAVKADEEQGSYGCCGNIGKY